MTIYRLRTSPSGQTLQKVSPKKSAIKKEKSKLIGTRPCPDCQVIFPVQEFMTRKGVLTYSRCKVCRRSTAKKTMRSRRAFDPSSVREYIVNQLGRKCIRCDYDEFVSCLEFHHVDAAQKESSLGRLINQFSYGGTPSQWDALEREALKCCLLCSNCHQAYHHGMWRNLEQLARRAGRPMNIPLFAP